MSENRRAHQCHRQGCDSEARWQLHLMLQCIGVGSDRIQLQLPSSIRVCNDKRHHQAAIEYLLSERNKGNIVAGLLANGFLPPDWSSALAAWVPIDPGAIEPVAA